MPEERKNHLKEILIGLFVTIVGGILVVLYQEWLHKNKGEKENETKLTLPLTNSESDGSKPGTSPPEKNSPKPATSQSVSQPDQYTPQEESIIEKNKPVQINSASEDEGLSIKIIDSETQRPVEGVSISFSGFSNVLTSNQSGNFIIPQSIIVKRGEYNSVRAQFNRNGFEPADFEIGLSEPQIFKIKKSQ